MPNLGWQRLWQRRLEPQSDEVSRPHSQHQPGDPARLVSRLALSLLLLVTGGSLVALLALVIIARQLPSPDRIVRREGFATKIFDRNGKLLYDVFANQRRTPVPIYQVPRYLKEATIAIEDKDFYAHHGFDLKGYARAVYYLLTEGRVSGGSTLTQQLVKNVLLTTERTVKRKLKEFVLALEIEAKYSKDQILQMYLNESEYGGTAAGVEEAAQTNFKKSVSDLNLVESAFLAGLPQRPSAYSPYSSTPTAYLGRTQAVLRRMREDGYITTEQESQALAELEELEFAPRGGTLRAPHFIMYVRQLLESKYGDRVVERGGLRVTTSLDVDLQEKVQTIVSNEIAKVERLHITNGSALVLDPQSGEILAMVGSKDYDAKDYDGKVNVVLAQRQPGSAIKPVTYVTGLKKGFTAATLIMDTKTAFPDGSNKPEYVPENYDGKEHGPLQVRYALGNSINVTAVKMLALVGVKEMLTTASAMGLTTLEPTRENLARLGLSVTLGGGEVRLIDLVSAYAAFANEGWRVEPVAILRVTDRDNNVLEEFRALSGKRVLNEAEAFIISDILSDNGARTLTFGENSLLRFPDRPVAVKTGTTNDKRDNWTIGWTPQVVAGVWVGNNDNSPMKEVASGISGASPIWRQIMLEFLRDKPRRDFTLPENVVQLAVDTVSGYRSHDGYPSRLEYFVSGTEPSADDPIHQKLKVCRGQGKLATLVDVARGDYEEKEYFVFKEGDPFSADPAVNRWQQGVDRWLSRQSDPRYHPPVEYCDTRGQVHIVIDPANHAQVGSDFTLRFDPVSEHEIIKVEVFIDGESQAEFTDSPYELSLKLATGPHSIKITAVDSQGNKGESRSDIGVNVPWDWQPSPTPSPTSLPTSTPVPTTTPVPASTPTNVLGQTPTPA